MFLGNDCIIIIFDFFLVELNGDWNLKMLGFIIIVIKGFGCIVFSGYGDNVECMRLVQGFFIIIEEGNVNFFVLLGMGILE